MTSDRAETARAPWPDGEGFKLFVAGFEPVAKGSMRAFLPKGHTRPVLTDGAGARLRKYEGAIRDAARAEMALRRLPCALRQPFEVTIALFFPRADSDHDRVGRVRGAARATPWVKPDIDKLQRSVLDAMTGVVWDDDARVVRIVVEKRFADAKLSVGTYIRVRVLPALVRQLAKQTSMEG